MDHLLIPLLPSSCNDGNGDSSQLMLHMTGTQLEVAQLQPTGDAMEL